jgi:hypothetical protein
MSEGILQEKYSENIKPLVKWKYMPSKQLIWKKTDAAKDS